MPKSYKYLPLYVILSLILAQCTSPNNNNPNSDLFATTAHLQPLPMTPAEQVAQYQNANTDDQDSYRIRLARALIKTNHHKSTAKLTNLPANQQTQITYIQQQLLAAHSHLLSQKYSKANTVLNKIYQDYSDILANESYYHLLQAYAAKGQQHYPEFVHHINKALVLAANDTAFAHNITQVYWAELMQNHQKIAPVLANNPNASNDGWLALSSILEPHNPALFQAPQAVLSDITNWQQQHSKHPANLLLKVIPEPNIPPKNIAVLLPKNKQTQTVSDAIENGIFASYYMTAPNLNQLKIINTSKEDIPTSYQKASDFQADANIGPVLRNEVDAINDIPQLDIPTLALNSIEHNHHPAHLTTYSIATAYEAEQLARSISNQGYKNSIIIYDNSSNHLKTLEHFTQHYTALGGKIVARTEATGNINAKISQVLGIGQSQQHFRQISKLLPDKIRFSPERRTDFDHILIIASNDKARQINPILHYHFADDVPIYGFSSLIGLVSDAKKDRDLDGIIFFDSPPLKHSNGIGSDILRNIYQQNPKEFHRNSRYNALGIDAYLITKLQYLWQVMPSYVIEGAGAAIYQDDQQHLQRHLEPMTYRHGKVKHLNTHNYKQLHWVELLNQAL